MHQGGPLVAHNAVEHDLQLPHLLVDRSGAEGSNGANDARLSTLDL